MQDETADLSKVGVRLADARPLIDLVKKFQIEGYEILNLDEGRPHPERVTVYICNHGPLLAPLPAPALTVDALLDEGGYDDLRAVTLFHRIVEVVPFASMVLRKYFGHATPKLQSMAGLIELMKQRRFHIVGTAPEGRSCTWRYEAPVGPFTKQGLMVAALEAEADVILTAQKGVECFGYPVPFPFGLRLPFEGGPSGISLPFWWPGRKAYVQIKYLRYQPLISAEERATLSASARREQIGRELTRMHEQLSALYQSI
jgi:hypothetical protein